GGDRHPRDRRLPRRAGAEPVPAPGRGDGPPRPPAAGDGLHPRHAALQLRGEFADGERGRPAPRRVRLCRPRRVPHRHGGGVAGLAADRRDGRLPRRNVAARLPAADAGRQVARHAGDGAPVDDGGGSARCHAGGLADPPAAGGAPAGGDRTLRRPLPVRDRHRRLGLRPGRARRAPRGDPGRGGGDRGGGSRVGRARRSGRLRPGPRAGGPGHPGLSPAV
ncbi:MAG: hypothetical protein AVDCRST_MAG19-3663, partial [uncultured Thermomicrobiales bacterium]